MKPTHEKLIEEGMLMSYKTGSTWNDGGSWNTWIYRYKEKYWKVHQPTDYLPDADIVEVVPSIKKILDYIEVE